MDPRERADALLSKARARGAFVVTPENAVSPMDASNTLQIKRSVVRAVDPDATTVVTAEEIRQNDATAHHHLAERAPTMELPVQDAQDTAGEPAKPPEPQAAAPTAPPEPQAAASAEPEVEPQYESEDVGGLIPTTTQRMKSSLTSRLDPPAPAQAKAEAEAEPEPEYETEDVGGLIPTTTQRMKSSLISRLDS